MTRVRFERERGYEDKIRRQPEFIGGMRARTTAVAVAVRQAAPDKTGYYKRHVRPDGTKVRATDTFWHLLEFGSVNNPPYAPLRRGVIASGLRFSPAPHA